MNKHFWFINSIIAIKQTHVTCNNMGELKGYGEPKKPTLKSVFRSSKALCDRTFQVKSGYSSIQKTSSGFPSTDKEFAGEDTSDLFWKSETALRQAQEEKTQTSDVCPRHP